MGAFFNVLFAQLMKDPEIVQFTIEVPQQVQRGGTFEISIRFYVCTDWYIYAPTPVNSTEGLVGTSVIFFLPEGITRRDKIHFPNHHLKNGHDVYEGDSIVLSQSIQVSLDLKPGKYKIQGRTTWQTCNSHICMPPTTEELMLEIEVL
jgi:hypothetical protein